MKTHTLVGFGFGPIQAGLFLSEAYNSGNFGRLVVAEIDQKLVDAARSSDGAYWVNVAHKGGIEAEQIKGVEIYNPNVETERNKLLQALSDATEIVTSLPSVDFYDTGRNSVASLIRHGLQNSSAEATIVYTAENNNHAAEILAGKINYSSSHRLQYLNTVIGKMSQVITNKQEIERKQLKPIAIGIDRAFLVEEFNRILVTKCNITDFKPGIEVFVEKEDLLPFEEAKLYGHNAIHFLLAVLGANKGYLRMKDLNSDKYIMQIASDAFISESGAALIKKYTDLQDDLFTEVGFKAYAEDLLERMTSPFLDDPVERIARDPIRKLGYNDRVFGTMRLALEYSIEPTNLALGAAAAIAYLLKNQKQYNLPSAFRNISLLHLDLEKLKRLLRWIWKSESSANEDQLVELVQHGIKVINKSLQLWYNRKV